MKGIIKKHIKLFVIVSTLIVVCNILNTLHPFVVKQIIDLDFSNENIIVNIIRLIVIYALIHISIVVLSKIKNSFNNKLVMRVLKDIREKLFYKVLKFKMKTFNKYNSSKLYTRLTIDVDNLTALFSDGVNIIFNNVIYIVFTIIMMLLADYRLAFIGIFIIFLTILKTYGVTKILGAIEKRISNKRDEQNKEFSEFYNKNKLIYLFGLQTKNRNKIVKLLDNELSLFRKYMNINLFPFWLIGMIQALGIYLIIYYALNINLDISLGSIYLVIYYLNQCKEPLGEIFNKLDSIQISITSYKKIMKILKEKDDEFIESIENEENIDGDIEFENVSMKYEDELIIKNLSFIIKKGTKVTIVGRTGVGKSTITNVLMKLYDVDNGRILIGGKNISEISNNVLRRNISYISQTPHIFEDSIRNNILLGKKNIKDEQIIGLMDEIGVSYFFEKMEKGLDTKIKFNKLSYGELQIIAFLRAILHKAKYYIFDEPTSNIDLKTEKMMQNIIDKISEQSTVIIIAHRKSTIESSDKIIYLKDGEIDVIVNKY